MYYLIVSLKCDSKFFKISNLTDVLGYLFSWNTVSNAGKIYSSVVQLTYFNCVYLYYDHYEV